MDFIADKLAQSAWISLQISLRNLHGFHREKPASAFRIPLSSRRAVSPVPRIFEGFSLAPKPAAVASRIYLPTEKY
jgi:hypothetical protein